MKKILPIFASLLLASCTTSAVPSFNFTCDNGAVVTVRHPAPERAVLSFGGREYALYQVRAASGTRYATEQGLTPETGLIWWSKGREAQMYEMVLDHTASAADYPLITSCEML